RDPATVAERLVERLTESERGVLGRVMLAGLEVAFAFDDRVEARMERELLEKVVVEAGTGRDAHAARAVERKPDRDARLGRRAQHTRAAAAGLRHGRGPLEHARESLQQH